MSAGRIALWFLLMLLAMVWGVLSGISLATAGYWLHPVTALFGCLGLVVIACSLLVAQTQGGAE